MATFDQELRGLAGQGNRAQALLAQALQPKRNRTVGSSIADLLTALISNKTIQGSQAGAEDVERRRGEERKLDLSRALGAFREDTPFEADLFPGEAPIQGLRNQGTGRDTGALAEALLGSSDTGLQGAGLKTLLSQSGTGAGANKAFQPITIVNDKTGEVRKVSPVITNGAGRLVPFTPPEGFRVAVETPEAKRQADILAAIEKATGLAGVKADTAPGIAADVTKVTEEVKNQVAAQADLPAAIQTGELTLDLLRRVRNHPGREISTGKTAPIGAGLSLLPGTDSGDFKTLLDQLDAKQFLVAFQSLKGGGTITEVEGDKATKAISNLKKSQTEEQFLEQLQILEDMVQAELETARRKAGGSPLGAAPAPATPSIQEGQTATNPNTGETIIFRGGQWQPL